MDSPPPAPDSDNDLILLHLAMDQHHHHQDHDPHLSALLDQLQQTPPHHNGLAMLSDEDLELQDHHLDVVLPVNNNNAFREDEGDPFLLETEIFAALSGIEDVVMVERGDEDMVEGSSEAAALIMSRGSGDERVVEAMASSSSRCAEDANDQQAFARACMSALLKSTTTNNNTKRSAAAAPRPRPASNSSRKLQKVAAAAAAAAATRSSTTDLSRLLDRKSTAHIAAGESTRRRQLTRHFHTLRALLPPDDTPLIDRCSIIDRTCEYIHSLEGKLVFLQKKQKVMRAIKSNMEKNPENSQLRNISLDQNDCDKPPYISIMLCKDGIVNVNVGCSSGSHQINFSNVLHALEKLGFDVLTANCSQGPNTILYAFSAKVNLLEFPIDELRSKLLQMMQWS